jgi:GTPase SAR1 family protein
MPLDLLTRLDPLRRIRCPFCFDEFAAFQMHVRCTSPICRADFGRQVEDPILTRALTGRLPEGSRGALKGPWWADPVHDPGRGFFRLFDWLVMPGALTCPQCLQPADRRLCPRCHHELPDRVLTQRRAGSITVFGPPNVGKTTYMTVLLQEIKKASDVPRRLGLRPLDEETRQRYRQDYYDVTYGPRDGSAARRPHTSTAPLELDPRVLQPLVFELKTRAGGPGPLVSFWDLAGQDWEDNVEALHRQGKHLIGRTRGLLLMIDPMRIPQVKETVPDLTEEERAAVPADYVEDADKLADFFARLPVRTPLAICLNKIDRWGPLLEEDTMLHQIARSVPNREPDRALDRTIHEEVRAALRRWGQEEFLDRLESDFRAHQFFACSALGDAAQVAPGASPPLPTPLLVERAALWLLDRQGLLR